VLLLLITAAFSRNSDTEIAAGEVMLVILKLKKKGII